jgi:hypothetical protein
MTSYIRLVKDLLQKPYNEIAVIKGIAEIMEDGGPEYLERVISRRGELTKRSGWKFADILTNFYYFKDKV